MVAFTAKFLQPVRGLALLLGFVTWGGLVSEQGIALAQQEQQSEDTGRYESLLVAYELADQATRYQWLEQLLTRSEYAARFSLTETELQTLRTRHRTILARVVAGDELTNHGVKQLIAEVDHHEQQAITRLSADFQYATAQAFHHNRAEFARWTTAWQRIDHAWRGQNQPLDWQPRIVDWLGRMSSRQQQAALAAQGDKTPIRPIAPHTGPKIQIDELRARIVGYNLAISRLVAELHSRSAWSTEDLGHAANELADLAAARHDLELYWSLLPPRQQTNLSKLEPLDGAIALLTARTSNRRQQLQKGTNESQDRTAWELRRLDEVSRRLATLASSRS